MHRVALSTSVRVLALGAAAAILSVQPLSSFAQTAPETGAASCSLPVLDLSNPSPGAMLLPGAYTVEGIAFDPEVQQGSGIDQVSLFLGDRDKGGITLGTTQPGSGPRQDGFSLTVTLPSTTVGQFDFQAYARSALTGEETRVSLPIVLGEDPSKAALVPSVAVESSTNPGLVPSSCPVAAITVPTPTPTIDTSGEGKSD
jgi:hypothetical protein